MFRNIFSILLLLGIFSCQSPDNGREKNVTPAEISGNKPFNPHLPIVLTRHARCRMECRHITQKEIHEILEHGEINYEKSEPHGHPDPKYAVEGMTAEGQHLRIIVAPEEEKLVIVTCIEINVEWQCDCG